MKNRTTCRTGKKTRADRLLGALRDSERVLVLTHDNPDPDAIASGWGIHHLVEHALRVPVRLVAGGIIARAENKVFVDVLKPPLTMIQGRLTPGAREAVVVIDTVTPHRLILARGQKLDAVVDHHDPEAGGPNTERLFRFRDIRPRVLSSSSIVACYLRHFSIVPPAVLATALSYGIDSDAKGMHCRFTQADRDAVSWLHQYADPQLLAQITNPQLSRQYYADLLLALESTFTYGPVAFCFLPSATATEAVGEIADLLIRCGEIDRLLCAAVVGERIVVSCRTSDLGGNATLLLGKTVDPEGGTWGGHEHRAGGSIVFSGAASDAEAIEARIRSNWLAASRAPKLRGDRLVAKKEILKALH